MVYYLPTLDSTDKIIFSGRYGQYKYWIHLTHLYGISHIANNNALLKAYSIDRNILDNIYMQSLWCKSGSGDRPTFDDWYPKNIHKMVHALYKYIKTIDKAFEYEVVSDWWVVKFSTLNKPQQEKMQATESEPKQIGAGVCKQLYEDYERFAQDRVKELARLQWGHTYKLPKTKTTIIPYL